MSSALAQQLDAAASVLSCEIPSLQAVDDAALVALSRSVARVKHLVDTRLAVVAGEIAARSTRAHGHSGLAQRAGFRSAEDFVKATTGVTGREAVTAVRVGTLVREASLAGEPDPSTGSLFVAAEPWLSGVAAAVSAGTLSVAAADAIRAGLGSPTDNVPAASLASAAATLVAEAASLDPDRLQRRARELRDDLDEAGIADRERERFEKRSLRHFRLANGMGRLVWDLDPESYAVVTELYDRATSPKSGVRFVSGPNRETADRILNDPRSIGQLASDTMLGLLQAGATTDSIELLGDGGASVRILVTVDSLDTGTGHGRIEGSPDPVSIETVERLVCNGSTAEVVFDNSGQPLDVGREQRFFTKKQRIALAVRDGGCRFGTCDRPPSMTEAHHIHHWARDGGRTDIKDGILFCKFHHLLMHNNGWEIERDGADYYLIPPPDIDPQRRRTLMPCKSPAMRDLRRQPQVTAPPPPYQRGVTTTLPGAETSNSTSASGSC